jgi:hypothetical protein
MGTLVLFGWSMSRKKVGEVDLWDALVAIGGLLVQAQSICILFMNYQWQYDGNTDTKRPRDGSRDLEMSHVSEMTLTFLMVVNSAYLRNHFVNMVISSEYRDSFFSNSYYSRPDSGRTISAYVWPVWILTLFGQNQLIAWPLFVYLTFGYVVEELVRQSFPRWKDPLAEKLMVL